MASIKYEDEFLVHVGICKSLKCCKSTLSLLLLPCLKFEVRMPYEKVLNGDDNFGSIFGCPVPAGYVFDGVH